MSKTTLCIIICIPLKDQKGLQQQHNCLIVFCACQIMCHWNPHFFFPRNEVVQNNLQPWQAGLELLLRLETTRWRFCSMAATISLLLELCGQQKPIKLFFAFLAIFFLTKTTTTWQKQQKQSKSMCTNLFVWSICYRFVMICPSIPQNKNTIYLNAGQIDDDWWSGRLLHELNQVLVAEMVTVNGYR